MIDLSKVHEKESFDLKGNHRLSLAAVRPVLEMLGFTFMDDFATLKRCDKGPVWQSETIASCIFFDGIKEVYPDESDFDAIRYSILVATLPAEQIALAMNALFLLGDKLSLLVRYKGSPLQKDDADSHAKRWESDILQETGDLSGSESVRILIAMEYDRKRRQTA